MHTYQKNGSRQIKLQEKAKVKKHLKGFYYTLGKIGEMADYLKSQNIEVTEDNVQEVCNPLVGRDLDGMEKMILLAKMSNGTTDKS